MLNHGFKRLLACYVCFTLFNSTVTLAAGRFEGSLVIEVLDDGRNLRVVQPFAFFDDDDAAWRVKPGTETDGASVPQFFWSLYPPFSGKYRKAAVLHDYYCQSRNVAWKKVHRMFYDAMLTSGVDTITAKVMYSAVYAFGPRWSLRSGSRAVNRSDLPDHRQRELAAELEVWIKKTNPSPAEIDARIRAMRVR